MTPVPIDVTAHLHAGVEPYIELRDLDTGGPPWASVRLGKLTILSEQGTADIFQRIADELRRIDPKPAVVEITDHVECVQPAEQFSDANVAGEERWDRDAT